MTVRVRELIESFGASLAQVLESMAGQAPQVRCDPPGPAPDAGDILWWEQALQISPELKIYVGSPSAAWQHAGNVTLQAAGIESVEESEARNTWIEILGQALSALARGIGGILGREVTCDGGGEHRPDETVADWVPVHLTMGETSLPPLYVAFSHALLDAVTGPGASEEPRLDGGGESAPVERSRTMNLLLDIDLPVSISFGKTQLAMRDVIKLTTGSIVELNRGVAEPVDVLVNGSLVARGEVVVVEGNYGVRILEIASRLDRMKTLR